MTGFTNYEEMFSQSIGLKEPWKVDKAEFDEKRKEVHIYVSCRKTAKYPCPKCGKMCSRYDDEEKERVWRHGDVVFFPCYVHCRRPRIKCSDGIHVVTAPWARPNSRYTLLFESYAMLLMKSMPVENARKIMRISHTSMTGILKYWVKKAVKEDDLSKVRAICVDETSFKKGHSYVTVISDALARRVIDVEKGRDTDTVISFSNKLEKKGGYCNKITQYISDMSGAYMSARDECFPNANSKKYPKTGRAYRMVQQIDDMYKCSDMSEAENIFDKLIRWLRRSRLEPMKKVASSLKSKKQEILNYFYYRMTNALAEGINSMIQSAKRRARGFRTFEGYACMIYLVVGKLNLSCPNPFS